MTLTQEVQPVTARPRITTSFGYDAAGNRTRYTDGNGNQWFTTYNTWNLPESQIEPATTAYTTAADRTFTTAYDADGHPVTRHRARRRHRHQHLRHHGRPDRPVRHRRRRRHPDRGLRLRPGRPPDLGRRAPGGTDTFTYDDRGLLLTATGPSGTSSFGYNADGQMTSRTDAAGTTSYTYDTAGRLATLTDPATGTTSTYAYNPMSQVSHDRLRHRQGHPHASATTTCTS